MEITIIRSGKTELECKLWKHFEQLDLDDQHKSRLIAELVTLSDLIIDSYLEYNKNRENAN